MAKVGGSILHQYDFGSADIWIRTLVYSWRRPGRCTTNTNTNNLRHNKAVLAPEGGVVG